MPLVSKIIPGFFGGVSQQSPALREDTYCEALTNGLTTLEYGLCMRPNTEWVSKLYDVFDEDLFTHTINRDSNEKYLVIIDSTTSPVKVYKLDGTNCIPCTIKYGLLDRDLNYLQDDNVKDYVTSSLPRTAFKATTIADYTIIANKDIAPSMSTDFTQILSPKAFIYVQQGGPGITYKVLIDDEIKATYTTGLTDASTYTTDVVCTNLLSQLNTALGGSVTTVNVHAVGDDASAAFTLTQQCWVNYSLNSAYANAMIWIYDSQNVEVFHQHGSTLSGSVELPAGDYTLTVYVTHGFEVWGSVSIPGNTGWMIERVGNTLILQRQDGIDFKFKCIDGQGDNYMKGIKGKVQKFQDLPPVAPDGSVLEVAGNQDNLFSSYYVKYESLATSQNGVWVETLKPGIQYRFDEYTMPHRLVRTGTNEFTLAPIIWLDRKVGNEVTAPAPSFLGKSITDVFFHKNRLGFLSGENTVYSKAGDYFNLWPSTGMEILDDDPIDIGVSSTQVNNLYHAISFNKGLLVFGNQEQFVSTAGDQLFTPKTAAFLGTTKYHTNVDCKPVGVGSLVYFAVPSGSYTQIREYGVQANSLIDDAVDITAHVPEYIPGNVKALAVATAKNILFALSSDDPKALYVYKYHWNNQEKIQSSWSRWTFDTVIANIMVIDNYLYLLVEDNSKTHLLKMNLERVKPQELGFRVHLDKQRLYTGSYDEATDTTSWTLAYESLTNEITVVATPSGLSVPDVVKTGLDTLEAPGDYSSLMCIIGVPYELRYRFSEWFIKDRQTGMADTLNRLQIRSLTITFTNTTYFHLEVKPNRNQATSFYPFTGTIVGQAQLGSPNQNNDRERFLTMCNARGTIIELVNDSYMPCELQTATFEGLYTIRANVL